MPTVIGKTKKEYDEREMAKRSGQSLKEEAKELSHAARELTLHADNNEQLYRTSHVPIIANLRKKAAKGIYDPEQATKLWGHHADRAAHSYHKEFGHPSEPWHKMFSPEDRREAAGHFESMHRDEVHEQE